MEGLCKLLLLRLGLDEKNQDINEGHELFGVVADLKTIANTGDQNPWRDGLLTREKFLQWHLAELFIKDCDLFEKTKKVVDFAKSLGFAPWQVRTKFWKRIGDGTLYNKADQPYNIHVVKKFLASDEQALAFYTCEIIRFLWYGVLNQDVLLKELDEDVSFFKKLKLLALKPSVGKDSFLSVWHQIIQKLLTTTERRNFVSFDDHGWVISFDQRIISAQVFHLEHLVAEDVRVAEKIDIDFLRQLRCAGVESWKGELHSFYKRPRNLVLYNELRSRLNKIKLFKLLASRFKSKTINDRLDRAITAIQTGDIVQADAFLKPLKVFDQAATKIQTRWRKKQEKAGVRWLRRSQGLF